MPFLKDTSAIIAEYAEAVSDENVRFSTVKVSFDRDEITGKLFSEKRAEHEKKLEELRADCKSKVDNALASYIDDLEGRYARTSKSIDMDDVALLSNSAIELTASDFRMMFEKHSGNPAMQGVVAERASKMGVDAGITFYSCDRRKADATDYATGIMAVLSNPEGLSFAMYRDGRAIPPSLVGE